MEADEIDECPICYEENMCTDNYVLLECKNKVCVMCFERILIFRVNCPFCRTCLTGTMGPRILPTIFSIYTTIIHISNR